MSWFDWDGGWGMEHVEESREEDEQFGSEIRGPCRLSVELPHV